MGMFMSLMGKGVPTTQLINLLMGTLHHQFMDKDINDFEDFHSAMLDIFSTVNHALPGKHYDVPSRKEIEECFTKWKEGKDPQKKKQIFTDFIKKNINLSRRDDTVMITGIVIPPAAMAAKRAGENVPTLNMIKYIPDVLFVPGATVAALVSVKFSRRMLTKNMAP